MPFTSHTPPHAHTRNLPPRGDAAPRPRERVRPDCAAGGPEARGRIPAAQARVPAAQARAPASTVAWHMRREFAGRAAHVSHHTGRRRATDRARILRPLARPPAPRNAPPRAPLIHAGRPPAARDSPRAPSPRPAHATPPARNNPLPPAPSPAPHTPREHEHSTPPARAPHPASSTRPHPRSARPGPPRPSHRAPRAALRARAPPLRSRPLALAHPPAPPRPRAPRGGSRPSFLSCSVFFLPRAFPAALPPPRRAGEGPPPPHVTGHLRRATPATAGPRAPADQAAARAPAGAAAPGTHARAAPHCGPSARRTPDRDPPPPPRVARRALGPSVDPAQVTDPAELDDAAPPRFAEAQLLQPLHAQPRRTRALRSPDRDAAAGETAVGPAPIAGPDHTPGAGLAPPAHGRRGWRVMAPTHAPYSFAQRPPVAAGGGGGGGGPTAVGGAPVVPAAQPRARAPRRATAAEVVAAAPPPPPPPENSPALAQDYDIALYSRLAPTTSAVPRTPHAALIGGRPSPAHAFSLPARERTSGAGGTGGGSTGGVSTAANGAGSAGSGTSSANQGGSTLLRDRESRRQALGNAQNGASPTGVGGASAGSTSTKGGATSSSSTGVNGSAQSGAAAGAPGTAGTSTNPGASAAAMASSLLGSASSTAAYGNLYKLPSMARYPGHIPTELPNIMRPTSTATTSAGNNTESPKNQANGQTSAGGPVATGDGGGTRMSSANTGPGSGSGRNPSQSSFNAGSVAVSGFPMSGATLPRSAPVTTSSSSRRSAQSSARGSSGLAYPPVSHAPSSTATQVQSGPSVTPPHPSARHRRPPDPVPMRRGQIDILRSPSPSAKASPKPTNSRADALRSALLGSGKNSSSSNGSTGVSSAVGASASSASSGPGTGPGGGTSAGGGGGDGNGGTGPSSRPVANGGEPAFFSRKSSGGTNGLGSLHPNSSRAQVSAAFTTSPFQSPPGTVNQGSGGTSAGTSDSVGSSDARVDGLGQTRMRSSNQSWRSRGPWRATAMPNSPSKKADGGHKTNGYSRGATDTTVRLGREQGTSSQELQKDPRSAPPQFEHARGSQVNARSLAQSHARLQALSPPQSSGRAQALPKSTAQPRGQVHARGSPEPDIDVSFLMRMPASADDLGLDDDEPQSASHALQHHQSIAGMGPSFLSCSALSPGSDLLAFPGSSGTQSTLGSDVFHSTPSGHSVFSNSQSLLNGSGYHSASSLGLPPVGNTAGMTSSMDERALVDAMSGVGAQWASTSAAFDGVPDDDERMDDCLLPPLPDSKEEDVRFESMLRSMGWHPPEDEDTCGAVSTMH